MPTTNKNLNEDAYKLSYFGFTPEARILLDKAKECVANARYAHDNAYFLLEKVFKANAQGKQYNPGTTNQALFIKTCEDMKDRVNHGWRDPREPETSDNILNAAMEYGGSVKDCFALVNLWCRLPLNEIENGFRNAFNVGNQGPSLSPFNDKSLQPETLDVRSPPCPTNS